MSGGSVHRGLDVWSHELQTGCGIHDRGEDFLVLDNILESNHPGHSNGKYVTESELLFNFNIWQFENADENSFQFIFFTIIGFNTRISYNEVMYPDWTIDLGWCSCYLSILCIPMYMGYRLLYFQEGDLIDVSIKNCPLIYNFYIVLNITHRNPFSDIIFCF